MRVARFLHVRANFVPGSTIKPNPWKLCSVSPEFAKSFSFPRPCESIIPRDTSFVRKSPLIVFHFFIHQRACTLCVIFRSRQKILNDGNSPNFLKISKVQRNRSDLRNLSYPVEEFFYERMLKVTGRKLKIEIEARNRFELDSKRNGERRRQIFEAKEICDRIDLETFRVYLYVSVDVS